MLLKQLQVPYFQVLWHLQANQERVDHVWRGQATWKILKRKCYGLFRPIKRLSMEHLGHVELTKMQKLLESKNKSKNENQNQNENKNENSFLFSFLFSFCFSFLLFFLHFHFCFCFCFRFWCCFHFRFSFCFSFSSLFSFSLLFSFCFCFHLRFCFCFHFSFCVCFHFRFCFCFCQFLFLNFTMAPLGHHTVAFFISFQNHHVYLGKLQN